MPDADMAVKYSAEQVDEYVGVPVTEHCADADNEIADHARKENRKNKIFCVMKVFIN